MEELDTREWGLVEFRVVGARQKWRCNHCGCLLPASAELDHVIPRWKFRDAKDGVDGIPYTNCLSNAQLLCGTCHAEKTMRERGELAAMREAAIKKAREEVVDYLKPVVKKRQKRENTQTTLDLVINNPFLQFAFK